VQGAISEGPKADG